MNNLTFSVNKVTGLSMRFLSVLFCLFVVCATAEAGNTFKYNYSVTVAPQTSNPGRGKVYMDATAAFLYENKTKWADLSDSNNKELYNANQTLTVSVSKNNENKNNQKSPHIQYTSVTLKAEALAGSKFTKWSWTENSEEKSSTAVTISIPCPEILQMNPNDDDDTESRSCPITYTAHFTPNTYYYKDPTIGKVGNGFISVDNNNWVESITYDLATVYSQEADDHGRYNYATVQWGKTYYAKPDPGFAFLGWFDGPTISSEKLSGNLEFLYDEYKATSQIPGSPTVKNIYAIFGACAEITKENAANPGFQSGTQATPALRPGSTMENVENAIVKVDLWDIDLSATFDKNGNALFDRIYIFGETTGTDDGRLYHETKTNVSNAATPCYIYEKSAGGDAYEYKITIANMNTPNKDKTWFDVTLDASASKRFYLTGWCPFGTTGSSKDEHGLLRIVGNANSRIDIYMEDCYLYSRVHRDETQFPGQPYGNQAYMPTYSTSIVNYGTTGAEGPASAIVLESNSTDANTPMNACIHIRGNNLVHSHRGCSATFLGQTMGQYSAPIFVRPPVNGARTTLTIDDIWLTDDEGNLSPTHTNGFLQFKKSWSAGPSIDLGNQHTILNFNGGRIELAPSLNTQLNYTNNMTICHRTGRADATVEANMEAGTAEDGTGGTVYFNDGSVWVAKYGVIVKDFTGVEHDNSLYFSDAEKFVEGGVTYVQTIRCPQNTYIRGGSHKGYIRRVSDIKSRGVLPTDGNCSLEQRVYKVGNIFVNEDGFVDETYFVNDGEGLLEKETVTSSDCGIENVVLKDYYEGNSDDYEAVGGSYGRAAIVPEADGNIYIWVPGETERALSFTNCQIFMPYFEAGYAGINMSLGGDDEVHSKKYSDGKPQHIVNSLVYAHLDKNMLKAAKEYRIPAKHPTQNAYIYTNISNKDDFAASSGYANVTNEESYDIGSYICMVRVAEADKWVLFSPPFDVKAMHILEVANENTLRKYAEDNGRSAALQVQGGFNIDLAAIIGAEVTMGTSNGKILSNFDKNYKNYVNYVRANSNENEDTEMRELFLRDDNGLSGLNNIINRTQLQHLIKKDDGHFNYDQAHYYLYKTGLTTLEWDINEDDENYLKIDWELAPDAAKNDGIVMNKGQVYAMQFPYCPGCNDGTKWDYWTGKILVLEGDGPQTIEGKNLHSTMMNKETLGLYGNSTLAELKLEDYVDSPANSLAYINNNGQFLVSLGDEVLTAGDAFLIPPELPTYLKGKRIKSINAETGAITWEEGGDNQNTTTGTPTISGNRQMMVYTIEGGVGIIPVTAQQVSIYNAAGQLITSQYLTEEVQISLPAGIYLISGEKEQAKAIVR